MYIGKRKVDIVLEGNIKDDEGGNERTLRK